MNMANVFPPFKIDIAGAFCVPRTLKDVREQYQNGQVSRQILQAVEDAEVRSLVERLELGGMKVVSDGGSEVAIFWKAGRVFVPKTAGLSPKALLWRLQDGSVCYGILFWKNSHFLIPLWTEG